jgi:hypothetical protein
MSEADERAAARLKESKANAMKERFNAGESAGAEYVLRDDTEFPELERLERWHEGLGMNLSAVMDEISFRQVADVMDEDAGADIEDLVRKANGDDIDHPTWVQGFVSGALSKFDALKPMLD